MTLFRMFQRRGTSAQWQAANTVLEVGEIGFSYDNNVIKIGDGIRGWNSLPSLDGKSAYEIAVDNGFEGTESAWLSSLAGEFEFPVLANSLEISETEFSYLYGLTSNIQSQISSRAPINSPSFTGAVSGVPSNGAALTASQTIGFIGLPRTGSGGTQGITAADAGKHIYLTGSDNAVNIPSNASVPFEIGTTIVIINGGTGTNVIEIISDDLIQIGTGLSGARQIAQHGMATLVKVDTTKWYISGVGLS